MMTAQVDSDSADEITFQIPAAELSWSRPEMYRGVVELCAPPSFLNRPAVIRDLLARIATTFDFTVMDYGETTFEPHGITAFTVIGESHVSVHTWPERRYAHVELLTCTPIPNEDELRDRFPVPNPYLVEVQSDVE